MAKREERYDRKGPIRKMAEADGYAMVRRPGCAPWVMDIKQWNSLWSSPASQEQGE